MKYDLERFLKAQEYEYAEAYREIQMGKKRGHWMWYIFPQIKGLGYSSTSQYYGIENLEEAKEYLKNTVLRNHLLNISALLLNPDLNDVEQIFGYIDSLKLKSCMTLFHYAEPENKIFADVLNKYFDGEMDETTIQILGDKVPKGEN